MKMELCNLTPSYNIFMADVKLNISLSSPNDLTSVYLATATSCIVDNLLQNSGGKLNI